MFFMFSLKPDQLGKHQERERKGEMMNWCTGRDVRL